MKSTKIWLGVGVAIIAGTNPQAAQSVDERLLRTTSIAGADGVQQTPDAIRLRLAQQQPQGQGGENEGGEAGIDAAAAGRDPVKYNIALQVIAAHFHAGLAAYEGGEMPAGAQMFAHGHAEVYAVMEDIFKRRGINDLGEKIEAALAAAVAKAPAADVKKRVNDVLAALSAAEKAGPKGALSPLAVKAKVTADMLDRAAAQYAVALKDPQLEPYLDGLGFALSAKMQTAEILPQLSKANPAAAKALQAALDLAGKAYPGIKRGSAKVELPALLAAASQARIAVANLR